MLKKIKIWYCWITKHFINTVRCMIKIWSPAKTTSTYCAWLNNVKWPSLNYPSCKISIVLYKHLCWTEQHHQHSKKIEVHSKCCFLNGLLTLKQMKIKNFHNILHFIFCFSKWNITQQDISSFDRKVRHQRYLISRYTIF